MDEWKSYTVEEIFQDDPDDPDNTIMTIPPEIMERMGWGEGDVIRIENTKEGLTITKVEGE
jgi:anaerobic selenocysteine-containing dehydrogenase